MTIVAIGSSVRPRVPSADIDLIVICREPSRMKEKSPLEIDLRIYQADKVNQEIAQGNDLLGWAVKFGRVIFQREGYWDAVIESWLTSLPLPSVEVFEQRAAEALLRTTKVYELGDMDAAQEQALSYVSHLGRKELIKRNVYPASRPELPKQLRSIGCRQIADWIEELIDTKTDHSRLIGELIESRGLTCSSTK